MGFQIAFCWSEDCEKELKKLGFEKQEVYMKYAPPGMTEDSNRRGDAEFFAMAHKPFQFVTTSFWGAGND